MLKVKYANEDNCFYSNNYKINNKHDDTTDDNEYMYMMGYESVHK